VQKNYILCHVRRVMGKAPGDDVIINGHEEAPAHKQAHSRIPNKINKVMTNPGRHEPPMHANHHLSDYTKMGQSKTEGLQPQEQAKELHA
jgi:hypothetical protein